MPHFSVFTAPLFALFSADFYRDVGRNWRGKAFLYLFLLEIVVHMRESAVGDDMMSIFAIDFSISTAMMVRTIRMATAAPAPQKIALPCWCGGSERAASAMTTALSPDNRMLMTMISSPATQNWGDPKCMAIAGSMAGYRTDCRSLPISAGFFVTLMPQASITSSFSSAVPLPPEMIAPA